MIQISCFAIGVALILNVVSQFSKEYAKFAEISCFLCISGVAIELISTIIEYVNQRSDAMTDNYISTLIKIAGVCFCVSISSEICSHSGYQTLGRILVVTGKAEIIVTLLPYITDMLSWLSRL